MKGSAAHWIIIGLVIGVIVIAVALGPLMFVEALDVWFFTDKTKLVKYATCSLAICNSGLGSPQVDKVGCLEREGGQCVKSCRQVAEEFKESRDFTFSGPTGRLHYCGEENALEFEFDNAVPIGIASGEIQGRAVPKWACEGTRLGDMVIGGSQNFQKDALGECIVMAAFNSKIEPGPHNWFNLHKQAPGSVGRECFDGFRDVAFAPLMPYAAAEDRIYPSALYLGSEFRAECEVSGSGPVHTGVPADFSFEDTPGETLQTFPQCSIRTADADGKKRFRVWSEAVVNKPYLEGIFGDEVIDPTTHIATLFDRLRSISEGLYSSVNTCALAVLSVEEESEMTFVEQQRLIASAEQLYPSLVSHNDELYLYFQESNDLDVSRLTSSAIKSVKLSTDGKFEALDRAQIVKGYDGSLYIQPSLTVLNGHRYLAYSSRAAGSGTWKIFVENVDTGDVSQVSSPDAISLLSPSITSSGGKLYLAAYTQTREVSSIEVVYTVGTVTESGIEWEDYRGIPDLKGNGENAFPSITATPEGVMVAYSFRDTAAIDSQDEYYYSIGTAILKDGSWEDAGIVAAGGIAEGIAGPFGSSDAAVNNGFPHLISRSGEMFVFFDQGSGSPGNSDFRREVLQSRYLGDGQWSEPTAVSDNRDLMASAVLFKDVMVLAYSELASDFDLVVATESGQSLNPEETGGQEVQIEVKADKESYASGESIVFSGTLELNDEPAAGEDVTIELTQLTDFGPLLKGGENVVTEGDGSFTWETAIELSVETKTDFEIVARYRNLKSGPYRFAVG